MRGRAKVEFMYVGLIKLVIPLEIQFQTLYEENATLKLEFQDRNMIYTKLNSKTIGQGVYPVDPKLITRF